MLRQKILKKCREDIYAWLNHENGQVAIYDAVNPTASSRRSLAKEFAKHDVQVRICETRRSRLEANMFHHVRHSSWNHMSTMRVS
jgi:6-phosphofructo-2-kinase/fructose-2,6-biphosphatase 4